MIYHLPKFQLSLNTILYGFSEFMKRYELQINDTYNNEFKHQR